MQTETRIREKEKTARTAESRKLCCNREKITEQRTVSTDRKHECFSAKYIMNIFLQRGDTFCHYYWCTKECIGRFYVEALIKTHEI